MLPDLRYVIGATLATAFLAVNSLGLFATVHLAHPAKLGPIEASRPMAFADRVDWNQFADPDGVWRLDELARKFGGINAATQYAPENPTASPQPAPTASAAESQDYDHHPESNLSPTAVPASH
jgi:hypothetical protein